MAGVSDPLPHLEEEEEEEEEEEGDDIEEALDPVSSNFLQYLDRPSHPFFLQSPHIRPSDPFLLDDEASEPDVEFRDLEDSDPESVSYSASDSGSDLFEGEEEEVSIALDLFDRIHNQQSIVTRERASNPSSDSGEGSCFRVLEENAEMDSDFLELGLGFGFDCGDEGDDHGEICNGVDGEGSDDASFLGDSESKSESGFSSEICEFYGDGLRISDGFGSDSDSDDGQVVPIDLNSDIEEAQHSASEDMGVLPLCSDCLRLGDGRDQIEEFDWEEVDRRTVDEENEAINMEIDAVINFAFDASNQEMHNAAMAEGARQSLDWEVLLAVSNHLDQVVGNHFEQNPVQEHEIESHLGDHDDYVQTTEYEVLFGQFAEAENSLRGSPPAAKYVVESLPSIFLVKEDIEKNNALCAICKDEILLDERVKRLPCAHHYHGECILPWLGIRNTCPVCRFELPTDDPDYENWRYQQSAHGVVEEGSRVRYDLEMLPEAEWL